MKILLFTHIFPYPLNEGGKVAQFGILEYLCKSEDVLLVSEENNLDIWDHVKNLQKIIPSLRIKILETSQPINSKDFFSYLLKKISVLQWLLQKKTYKHLPNKFNISDNPLFIYPTRPRKSGIINQLIKIVNEEKPDLIQVDFIDNSDIVNLVPVGIKKVLIHHDLRYTSVMQACKLQNETIGYSNYLSSYVQTIETAFLNKFDAVVTFSEDDKSKLSSSVVHPEIETIPFSASQKNIPAISDQHYPIKKLIFIGPSYHFPNYDAVEWYAREMADAVFGKYKLQLVVIGNWSASARATFDHVPGINFTGFAENLKEAMDNAIMLVPLRIGSGIRTKLLDAFAYGTPIISTSIGCEGLGAIENQDLIIADDPKQFMSAIGQLVNDPELVHKLRMSANRFVNENYSQDVVGKRRLDLYKNLTGKI